MVDSTASSVHFLNSEHGCHSWHGISSPTGGSNSIFQRQSSTRGSMRKVLPPVPDMDLQMSLSAKMIDKRTCTPKGNHSYGPFFLEYSLLAEYNLVQDQKLPGIYVIPSAINPLKWFGVIFIRYGIYQGGVFRFHVLIPENYPDGDCPRVLFEDSVFHPLIDSKTHEFDIRRFFRKWRRNVNHIWQILHYVRKTFYKKIDIQNPFNSEAAKLYEGNLIEFKSRVSECISEWTKRIYERRDEDPHYLTFDPYDSNLHGEFRKVMDRIRNKEKEPDRPDRGRHPSKGLTFMDPNTFQIFARMGFNTEGDSQS